MFIYCICTQCLVGAPFALITASIRRGMEVISLWHGQGGMEAQVALIAAFRSSALLGLVSLIFLLTIPHRFSMGFRSGEFAGQSSTVTPWSLNQLLHPKSSLTVETSHWTSSNMDSLPLHSSSRLWDLDFQMKCKIYFHLKRGLWTTEQQSSSFSPQPR